MTRTGFEGTQPALQEEERPECPLALLGDCVDHLDHRPRGEHPVEIRPQRREGFDHRNLCDRPQVASLIEHQIDVGEWLETTPKRLLVLRTPLATARTFPWFGLRSTTTRSASPNGNPRRTIP